MSFTYAFLYNTPFDPLKSDSEIGKHDVFFPARTQSPRKINRIDPEDHPRCLLRLFEELSTVFSRRGSSAEMRIDRSDRHSGFLTAVRNV
jgi:hypothetical protein